MLLAVLALAGCGAGAPAPTLAAGQALSPPHRLAPFQLVDAAGDAFGPARLQGRWTLLFSGFTHCPDVCPATLALLARLRARVPRTDLQLVFLSVDPARDTPAVLADYVAFFGGRVTGVTGTPTEVDAFANQLGLAFVPNPGAGGEYTVDHSTALVLLDPQARVAGYFRAPQDVARLAVDLAALPRVR